MSTETADPGHGHSPAARTSVTIMLIAVTIGTVAFFLDVQWLVWVSAVILVIGLIVGWVLSRVGYGVGGDKVTSKAH
jgi:hypothetical protein